MDVSTFIEIYRPLLVTAFYIAAINWIGYTVLAPWNKSSLGRVIWTLFLSIVLILLVPYLQVMHSQLPHRYILSILAMCFFIVALLLVGYGIYTTQIRGYLTYRNQLRKSKKLMDQEESQ